MGFQAGPYAWTYTIPGSGTVYQIGVVDGPPEVTVQPHYEPVRGDNLGDAIQDGVLRGQSITLDMIFQEWNPENFRIIWPFNTTLSINLNNAFSNLTNIGCLLSEYARTISATRIYGCPEDGGYLWTFYRVVPHPDFAIKFAMGSRLRNVPMRFLVLPFLTGGIVKYYDVTVEN